MASGQSSPMPAHEPVIFFSPSTNSNGRTCMISCSPMMPKAESSPPLAEHGEGLLVGLGGADGLDGVVDTAPAGEALDLRHGVGDLVGYRWCNRRPSPWRCPAACVLSPMTITGAQARSTAMRACRTPRPQPMMATLPPRRAFMALAAWMTAGNGLDESAFLEAEVIRQLDAPGEARALTYSANVPSVWMPSWVKLLHSSC